MRRFIFALFICTQVAIGQTFEVAEKTSITADQFIGYDTYANLYTITGMVLDKVGPSGNFRFTDFQLGNISSVDIINPLNVVVFYADTNTAVLLDNRLTEIERVNFNTLETFANISSARNAGGNKLWLFNADLQQLEIYNYRFNTKSSISLPISEVVSDQASNFNYNYILTSTTIHIYTVFGGLVKSIPFKDGEKLVQHRGTLMVLKENMLYKISENSEEPIQIKTPQISIQDLQLSQDFLYIYDRKNVHTLATQKPKK